MLHFEMLLRASQLMNHSANLGIFWLPGQLYVDEMVTLAAAGWFSWYYPELGETRFEKIK